MITSSASCSSVASALTNQFFCFIYFYLFNKFDNWPPTWSPDPEQYKNGTRVDGWTGTDGRVMNSISGIIPSSELIQDLLVARVSDSISN